MKKTLLIITMCIGFLLTNYISAQKINLDNLEVKIDALIPKEINDTTPGLVVGVVHKGALVFSKGYGLANLAYGIPNTPKMVHNIGSVSKQFLGYAFAMLHVNGSLHLDDPVSKYLEDWPTFDHTVSLRHLLSHTSGYREAYTMSSLAGRNIGVDHLSREECLNVVRKQPQLEFVPGSRYTYNSTAWVILAEVLEKVTGTPADEWVENNMLKPLKMKNTEIETYVGEVIQNAAESYVYNKNKGYRNLESNRAIFGAAEVYSSIEELTLWINNYRTAELGGKEVNSVFLDPFILNDGSNANYALGIGTGTYKGLQRIIHSGSHEAFLTFMSYYPEQDIGIITISNFGRYGRLRTSKIADIILADLFKIEQPEEVKTVPIKKTTLEDYVGTYLSSDYNDIMQVKMSNDMLSIEGRSNLIPISENTFKIKGRDIQYTLDSKEGQLRITEIGSRSKQTYNRINPWKGTAENLKKYQGDYWSDELETVYHLSIKNDKIMIEHRWMDSIVLDPITEDVFHEDEYIFVRFTNDINGDISGFSIHSGRTLDVRFQRLK